MPTENKLVTSNSNGKIVPYSNYDPSCDSLTRYKKFSQYSELAVWNNWLPNRYHVKQLIYKLRNLPEYHHLSIACIGYDSKKMSAPDVQLGLTGDVETFDNGHGVDPNKHAAAREVYEELGLSGTGTQTSSINSAFPIDNCIMSIERKIFLFVIP